MFDILKGLIDFAVNGGPLDIGGSKGTVIPITPHLTRAQAARGRILIERDSEPYWKERGWIEGDNSYIGFYKTRFCECGGEIAMSPAGYCTIHIKNPPPAVRRHPKWVCFHHKRGHWYRVHTVRECRDVASAIFEIEKIITESYELYS